MLHSRSLFILYIWWCIYVNPQHAVYSIPYLTPLVNLNLFSNLVNLFPFCKKKKKKKVHLCHFLGSTYKWYQLLSNSLCLVWYNFETGIMMISGILLFSLTFGKGLDPCCMCFVCFCFPLRKFPFIVICYSFLNQERMLNHIKYILIHLIMIFILFNKCDIFKKEYPILFVFSFPMD